MLTSWFQAGVTPNVGQWVGSIAGVSGTTTAGVAGTIIGYSRPGWYNAATPIGSIQTDLFVDRRDPANPKTIRLMGIVQQQNSYIVIGWKNEPTIPPSPTMPSMQGSLKILGKTFTLSSGTRPGVQAGHDGLYWTVPNIGMVNGQPFSFEFS